MDFMRSCYRSKMALYRDRPDVLTDGAWHFSPPGAKGVPYFHLFGSSNYDPDGRIDPPIGEQGTSPRPWSNGKRNPRLLGVNTCGTREQWEEGSLFSAQGTPPVDADGVGLCCVALPLLGGGDGDGGAALQGAGFLQAAEGGDGDGGQAVQYASGVQLGAGGDGDGGQAVQYASAVQLGAGGDGDDGQAVQFKGDLQVGAGGDGGDGQALQFRGDLQVGTGGDGDDGQAYQAANPPWGEYHFASGGASMDGSAGQYSGGAQLASGGASMGGTADQAAEYDDMWIKYTIPFGSFQVAGTTKDVVVRAIASTEFLHNVVCYVQTNFVGAGMFNLFLQPKFDTSNMGSPMSGLAGNDGLAASNQQATAKSAMPSGANLGKGSFTAAKNVIVTATSSGANLSVLSAGSLVVWINVSTMP